MKYMHVHKAKRGLGRVIGWTECVTPTECAASPKRQSAHGSIVRIDTCSCGAIRKTEINRQAENYGQWEVKK